MGEWGGEAQEVFQAVWECFCKCRIQTGQQGKGAEGKGAKVHVLSPLPGFCTWRQSLRLFPARHLGGEWYVWAPAESRYVRAPGKGRQGRPGMQKYMPSNTPSVCLREIDGPWAVSKRCTWSPVGEGGRSRAAEAARRGPTSRPLISRGCPSWERWKCAPETAKVHSLLACLCSNGAVKIVPGVCKPNRIEMPGCRRERDGTLSAVQETCDGARLQRWDSPVARIQGNPESSPLPLDEPSVVAEAKL